MEINSDKEGNWTDWQILTKDNEKPTRQIIEKGGKSGIVYQIGLLQNDNPSSIPVGATPKDEQGIIYIGKQTYSHRLNDHLKAFNYGGKYEKKSPAARRWREYYVEKFGNNFRFRYKIVEDAEAAEKETIKNYFKEFSRLPVLNCVV